MPSRVKLRNELLKKPDALLGHGLLATDRVHHVSGDHPTRVHIALGQTDRDRVCSKGGKNQRHVRKS